MGNISPALRLGILYLVVSSIWILLSDLIVARLAQHDADVIQRIQSVKGLVFVLFCSALLFFVSRRYYRNIERSLVRSEEMLKRYQALSEATKEGIVDHDLNTDIAQINGQMRFFLKHESFRIEHFTLRYRKSIHPEDEPRVYKNFRDTLKTKSNVWQADFRLMFYDGTYHDVINRGYIMRDKDGKPFRMISAIQDVTEIRAMKTAIFHQELKHKLKLGQSIIEAQEQERNRWAEELHDNVCQVLTVVKLYLEQVQIEMPDSAMLQKTQEMTAKALSDIRQLSSSIKPPQFAHTTLPEALTELFTTVSRVRTYRYDIDTDHFCEKRLKPEQKLMIYRVVQEQLSNIIRYAEAENIKVKLSSTDDNVQIEVSDDGKGFDTTTYHGGIGLKNIRSRLEIYSGDLQIESAPGEGCRLLAHFSLT